MVPMRKLQELCSGWTLLALLSLSLVLAPRSLYAQQDEIPLVSGAPSTEGTRVVAHRPRLYSVKKVAHPVFWFEGAISPVLRIAERFGGNVSKKEEEKTPPESGIKFGAGGLGGSTGFGPMIKPFHHNLFNAGIRAEASALITYKWYQAAGARVDFPLISGPDQGVEVGILADYVSRPSDFFYGIGNETAATNGSRFRTVSRTAGAGLNLRFNKSWLARLESGFRSIGVTEPREPKPMALVFQGQDIPGQMTGATMNVSTALLQRNTKDHPSWAQSGGLQRFEATLAEGLRGGDFSYWRYRLNLQQFLPLSEDHREVIALRAAVETNQDKGGSRVPFFDMATIGGSSTLRGYMTNRFTDKSSLTLSAEYRYRIWRYFDLGFFTDAGQVAPEVGDFAMDNFHMGYGVRFFARSAKRRGVIVDLAHSREAWVVYLDFSPLF